MNSIAFAPSGAKPARGLLGRVLHHLRHLFDPGLSARPTSVHIAITGHVNGSYSLAAVNRGLARSIERVRPGGVRLVPVEGVETSNLSGVPKDEPMAALVRRGWPRGGQRVVISQHYPLHVPRDAGDAALALFYWEESIIPIATVRTLNQNFQGVLAPSVFVAKALVDSGVHVPVHWVGQAPALDDFRRIGAQRRVRTTEMMSFLHVSSCMERKGVDILLAAYQRAFRRGDAVRLVIKGFPNPHNDVPAQVARLRAADPEAAEIVVINEDLPRAGMLELYRAADVMVLPTRGEGFGLPAAEAIAAMLPLIVTGHGGHCDFCSSVTARLLDFGFAPSGSHVSSAHSVWADPSKDDLVAALREAYADPGRAALRTQAARLLIDATMSDTALVGRIMQAATACLSPQSPVTPAVLITHRPSLLAWPMLALLLSEHHEAGRAVAVRLCDTADLDTIVPAERSKILAALSLVGRVIVGDIAGLARLSAWGLAANTAMLPQDGSVEMAERMDGMLLGLGHEQRLADLL